MEMKMKATELKKPMKKYEPKAFKTFEPMPMMKRPMMKPKPKLTPAKENPTKMSPGAMRRADTTTMETYKKQGKPATSTTTTAPAPRLKKAEAGPSFLERAKSGLKSLLPQPGKLAYNEDKFEPEKKMVGKAQRGMKSYLKGSMGKGGM